MKFDLQRIDDLNARLTLVIEKEDYVEKLEENFKKYSKKLNIKGFRSGKTPRSVLNKMYGKGMLEETVTGILNERLFKYLEDEKLDIFGVPMMAKDSEPVDFNPKSHDDYTFIFNLGLKPSVQIALSFDQPLEAMTMAVDETAIDEEIGNYRRMFGKEDDVAGSIESFDKVSVGLRRMNAEGVVEETAHDAVIMLENSKGEAKQIFTGKKKGDVFQADLEALLGQPRQYIVRQVLKLEEDPAPDAPLMYEIEIRDIKRPQLTPLTSEQVAAFTGNAFQDEDQLRKMLAGREENANRGATEDMKKMVVRAHLLKNNPFAIPEEFLLNWVNSQRDQKIQPGTREANNLFRDAKWSFMLNRIAADAGLEVTDKDIQKQVTRWVTENVDYRKADIRKLLKELYANEYFMSTMKENATEDVVFAHILPQFTFNEKQVTKDEFEKAFHDLHHELFDHGDHSHD